MAKKVKNKYAICTASIAKTAGTRKRSDWSSAANERYERCKKDLKEMSDTKKDPQHCLIIAVKGMAKALLKRHRTKKAESKKKKAKADKDEGNEAVDQFESVQYKNSYVRKLMETDAEDEKAALEAAPKEDEAKKARAKARAAAYLKKFPPKAAT